MPHTSLKALVTLLFASTLLITGCSDDKNTTPQPSPDEISDTSNTTTETTSSETTNDAATSGAATSGATTSDAATSDTTTSTETTTNDAATKGNDKSTRNEATTETDTATDTAGQPDVSDKSAVESTPPNESDAAITRDNNVSSPDNTNSTQASPTTTDLLSRAQSAIALDTEFQQFKQVSTLKDVMESNAYIQQALELAFAPRKSSDIRDLWTPTNIELESTSVPEIVWASIPARTLAPAIVTTIGAELINRISQSARSSAATQATAATAQTSTATKGLAKTAQSTAAKAAATQTSAAAQGLSKLSRISAATKVAAITGLALGAGAGIADALTTLMGHNKEVHYKIQSQKDGVVTSEARGSCRLYIRPQTHLTQDTFNATHYKKSLDTMQLSSAYRTLFVYELDACSHVPYLRPRTQGWARTGEQVDVFDHLTGQARVVARGAVFLQATPQLAAQDGPSTKLVNFVQIGEQTTSFNLER